VRFPQSHLPALAALLVALAAVAAACGGAQSGSGGQTDTVTVTVTTSATTAATATTGATTTTTTPAAAITVTSPAPGTTVPSPVVFKGTANVNEGTVYIQLRRPTGAVLSRTYVTATCGTGCTGTFAGHLAAPAGFHGPAVLHLFEASAADGSDLHGVDVRITVS
jgi:hypothetical protein